MNGDVQQDEEWDQRKDQAKASEEARIQRRDNEKKQKQKAIEEMKSKKKMDTSQQVLYKL